MIGWLVLLSIGAFLIGFGVRGLVDVAFAYELTQNDTDEGRILAICIDSQIQLDYCNQIYGGGNYGDKIQ